ncbi:hypothetical protein G6F46_011271 [Rhizopus delemar]|uniref:Fungal lipase-like domain-containing protein n=2 Tax=Rhizopus TaxID=4842 RepID=A0A9P6YTJ4_9FUNG|nr:hypothetical protein G6F55_010663 [Rhizopus delemar]KAG1535687.1 hypothetical protein G6F51_011399 [Rhizopus arrhizus]KAG1490086.1 hypothetical protein G6F54_010980 [Rhizopus delemar]KAG1501452.1 hypothetical protein G6F53_011078 [Rhizopus delemar]KAG1518713.1 hypothetical protein G6F52_008970 [Rhizopus delemar]
MPNITELSKSTWDYLFPPQFQTVNCWYCGEDTDLDLKAGESERHWYCSHCENVNRKDENGDIIDPSVPSKTLDPPFRVTTYVPYKLDKTKPKLCDRCINKQSIIRWFADDFIPDDENQPDYNERVNRYVEYKRYLDNRYDLCKDCFYKLEEYTNTLNKKYGQARQMEPIREDEDILRRQHELTEYDRCTVKEAYRYRSLTKFKTQRLIWVLTHVLSLLFFLYMHRHPQIVVKTNALWEDVLLYPFGIPSLKDVTRYLYDHLKWIIPSYYSDIKIILMCFEDKSRDYCDTLTITNGARELFVLHLMAYYGICWHPALYTCVVDERSCDSDGIKVVRWQTSNQSILFAMDPRLNMFDKSILVIKYLEDSDLFHQRKRLTEGATDLKRPKYSLSLAYTLSIASKLVYEDVEVIKYELKKAGFDIDRTFRPIAYKNICAFIAEKDDDILLVFRGTNPLNMQNYITNITFNMTQIQSLKGVSMGKVHQGFWKAMGEPKTKENKLLSKRTLRIELNNTSVYRTIVSVVKGVFKMFQFLSVHLFHHVKEPIDNTWIGPDQDIRSHSMYSQAEQYILELLHKEQESKGLGLSSHGRTRGRKRLFITGHSLGGAMGTIFLAKMLQSNSPLLDYFEGLYTFGQPKIGDAVFSRVFSPQMSSKIFHHAYNNDIIPRVPTFSDYYTPPGTLVFIDSAYNITLYPPNPHTNEPVPVRPISFVHLSGLLNRHVIKRLVQENQIRILFRILFPFFLNDHFPSDYCDSLRKGKVNWVIMGSHGLEGGNNNGSNDKDDGYSIVDVHS